MDPFVSETLGSAAHVLVGSPVEGDHWLEKALKGMVTVSHCPLEEMLKSAFNATRRKSVKRVSFWYVKCVKHVRTQNHRRREQKPNHEIKLKRNHQKGSQKKLRGGNLEALELGVKRIGCKRNLESIEGGGAPELHFKVGVCANVVEFDKGVHCLRIAETRRLSELNKRAACKNDNQN